MNGEILRKLSDKGASAAEYAGLVVLAAIILGALTPLISDRLLPGTEAAICRIFGERGCDRAGDGRGGSRNDFGPPWRPPYREPGKDLYQLELCSQLHMDCAHWDTSRGVSCNDDFIEKGYAYYQHVFDEHPEVTWAGLAKLAGTTVYAAMQDIHLLRLMSKGKRLDFLKGLGLPGPMAERLANLPTEALDYFEDQLAAMQKAIFTDLAPELEAYSRGGITEMERLARIGQITPEALDSWKDIASGEPERIKKGNKALAYREQHDILQPFYDDMKSKPFGDDITYLFGFMIDSPVPGGESFKQYVGLGREITGVPLPIDVPVGNVATFDTRWKWITDAMYRTFNDLYDNDRQKLKNVIDAPLVDRAKEFRVLPDILFPYDPKDGKC